MTESLLVAISQLIMFSYSHDDPNKSVSDMFATSDEEDGTGLGVQDQDGDRDGGHVGDHYVDHDGDYHGDHDGDHDASNQVDGSFDYHPESGDHGQEADDGEAFLHVGPEGAPIQEELFQEDNAELFPGGFIEDIVSSGYDNVQFRKHSCTYKYPDKWVSNVTSFCCEDSAIAACNEYQKRNCCALSHIRGGGRPDLEKGKKGKINLVCVSGIDQTRSRNQKALMRKKQHTNFKGCRMRIFIRQQLSGLWILRSFIPEHVKENGDLAHLSGTKTRNNMVYIWLKLSILYFVSNNESNFRFGCFQVVPSSQDERGSASKGVHL